MSDMQSIRVCALTNSANKFDSTWGELIREVGHELVLFPSHIEFASHLKENNYDIVIIENAFDGDLKGHVFLSHLKQVSILPFSTITILCSSISEDFFAFNAIDLRPDFVSEYPFNKKNALHKLDLAKKAMIAEREIRLAFTNKDHHAVAQLCKSKNYTGVNFTEILFESASRSSSIKSLEAKLYAHLKNDIWPAYLLARFYLDENDLQRLEKLIDSCRQLHGNNFGLSYLYFKGNQLIQKLQLKDMSNMGSTNHFAQFPEFLFWISEQEFEQKNYLTAVTKQIEAIGSVKDTVYETKEQYEDLRKYTDAFIAETSIRSPDTIELAKNTIEDAYSRDLLDESFSVSAKMFKIRVKLLMEDERDLADNLYDLLSEHPSYLSRYPHIIGDCIETIMHKQKFNVVKGKLISKLDGLSPRLQAIISGDSEVSSLNSRLKDKISKADILIKDKEFSDAEDVLSQVLGTSPGHHEATCLYLELILKITESSGGFAIDSYKKKIYSLIERINKSKTEWERSKLRELEERAANL